MTYFIIIYTPRPRQRAALSPSLDPSPSRHHYTRRRVCAHLNVNLAGDVEGGGGGVDVLVAAAGAVDDDLAALGVGVQAQRKNQGSSLKHCYPFSQ